MAQLIVPPQYAERPGEGICRELKLRGYVPVWLEPTETAMAIGFNLAPDGGASVPWTKAFHVDKAKASADAFEAEIRAWKSKVLGDLRAGKPSQTVRNACGVYGELAVRAMLAYRNPAAAA